MCQYLGLVISRKVENIGDTKGVKRPNESLNLDVLAPSRCLKVTEKKSHLKLRAKRATFTFEWTKVN